MQYAASRLNILYSHVVRSIRLAELQHLSQRLQETEHFCRWRQEKVAKIVQYGPPFLINNLPEFIIIRSSSIRIAGLLLLLPWG